MKKSLKAKIFLSYCLFIFFLILSTFFIIDLIVRETVNTVEEQYLTGDIREIVKYLDIEQSNFSGLTKDWAAWTDAWLFMQEKNPEFVENLTIQTFQNNDLSLIAYFDLNGRLKKGFEYRESYNKLLPVEESFWKRFIDSYLFHNRAGLEIKELVGFSFHKDTPILVSVYHVLKSDFSGPKTGYLIMSREIKKEKENLIKDIFYLSNFKIENAIERKDFSENLPIIIDRKSKYEAIYLIKDFFGNYNLALRIEREKTLWNVVKSNLLKFVIFYFCCLLFFGFIFYLWLNNNMIKKINQLIEGVKEVKEGKINKISIKSSHELEYLAEAINSYIQSLNKHINEIEANRKLFETIAEESEAIIFLFNKEGKLLFANSKAYDLLNKEKEFSSLEDLFSLLVEIIRMNNGEKTFLSEFKLKGGLFINGWIVPIDGMERIAFIGHDITDLKREKEKLIEKAIKDDLTSLYNRGHLESYSRKIFNGFRKEVYCLLFIDLDDLKKINDNFGHLAGDEVIKEIANSIHKSIRKEDLAARWGGDEFIVIIKGNLETAQKIAERIQENIQKAKYSLLPESIKPSVSIGITVIDSSQDLETEIRKADKAAYDAKREGKSRIKIFNPQE